MLGRDVDRCSGRGGVAEVVGGNGRHHGLIDPVGHDRTRSDQWQRRSHHRTWKDLRRSRGKKVARPDDDVPSTSSAGRRTGEADARCIERHGDHGCGVSVGKDDDDLRTGIRPDLQLDGVAGGDRTGHEHLEV